MVLAPSEFVFLSSFPRLVTKADHTAFFHDPDSFVPFSCSNPLDHHVRHLSSYNFLWDEASIPIVFIQIHPLVRETTDGRWIDGEEVSGTYFECG